MDVAVAVVVVVVVEVVLVAVTVELVRVALVLVNVCVLVVAMQLSHIIGHFSFALLPTKLILGHQERRYTVPQSEGSKRPLHVAVVVLTVVVDVTVVVVVELMHDWQWAGQFSNNSSN